MGRWSRRKTPYSNKNSMHLAILFFLLGVVLFQQSEELPARHWLVGAALLPLVLRWRILLLPLALPAGLLWALLHATWIAGGVLPESLEGVDVELVGTVASLVERDARRARFRFRVESLHRQGEEFTVPRLVLLSWYGNPPALRVGDRWRLTARLKRPHGFMNPGGFDYEKWLFHQRIGATGYVRADSPRGFLGSAWYSRPVDRLRDQLRRLMLAQLGDHPLSGLVAALAIGERGGIREDQWQVLTTTGTNHLMAISGLHIGLIAGLAFFLGRHLWCRVGRAALLFPAPRAAAVMALLAATGYAALAGFSIPTQRALIMVVAVMAALLLGRWSTPLHGLLLALGGVLLLDPMAVVTPGFWLSFAAVAVILYGVGGRLFRRSGWRLWGRVQWVVALGLLPLLAIYFQQLPLLSPLANLVAVPWVGMAVVPLILLGAVWVLLYPPLGGWLLRLAADLLAWLWPVLEWLAELDFARWQLSGEPSLWAVLAAATGVLWMLAPRGIPARWVGGIWLLPMVLAPPERPPVGEAWFTLLDVGQGLAAVVQTRNHALVYDTGPKFSERFDAGKAVVVPFLRSAGIASLDMLVVGHGDNDHIGGARSLLRSFRVRRLLSTVPGRLPEGAGLCRRGESWRWDGVRFSFLHPKPDSAVTGNDASCVLRVETDGGALLLTGDIERRAERELLAELPSRLAADILVAPHHGSRSSSQRRFVAAVDPAYVLFPVGYRNRFRHPHPEVVQRYRETGATLLDSATHGAIRFRLGGEGISAPLLYRATARRYWNRS